MEAREGPTNPWLAIVESALHHPDEHLVKSIRALSHYAQAYGARGAGTLPFAQDTERSPNFVTQLDGADDVLDGTLFVRVAGEAIEFMGWAWEGEGVPGDYDRGGLGWDELWEGSS
jgi:hypothetical protein